MQYYVKAQTINSSIIELYIPLLCFGYNKIEKKKLNRAVTTFLLMYKITSSIYYK